MLLMKFWARRTSARPSIAARSTPRASRVSRASKVSAPGAARAAASAGEAVLKRSASGTTAFNTPAAAPAAELAASAGLGGFLKERLGGGRRQGGRGGCPLWWELGGISLPR